MSRTAILYYAHDPMCSWCWGFRPCWQQVQANLPKQVHTRYLLGGLAADDEQPMNEEMRRYLQNTWRSIQDRIPGTHFNFDFWELCKPRRSTYPACRAIIAAKLQGESHEQSMLFAIQQAYYEQARNPSNVASLVELAIETGLDGPRFLTDLGSAAVEHTLQKQIQLCRHLAMTSFPSLQLEVNGSRWPVPINYTDPHAILGHIRMLLEE